MGTCPVCNGAVPDDFGLVECESCGAQLIVHVDGSVEYSGAQESGDGEPTPEPVVAAEPTPVPVTDPDQEVDSAPIHHFAPDEFELPPEEPMEFSEPESEPEPEPQAEPAADVFDGASAGFAEEAPMVYKSPSDPASPDLSDIEQFANSADSGGREGPLKYTILVSGIDTSDVRSAFREAITDRKFMWDTEQILRSIRQGEVQIANVPPGKAFILINRLRALPVRVSWEQNAVVQA